MKKVAVIIINFNGEKDTIECLESLQKVTQKTFELLSIVVDNGSKEKLIVSGSKLKVKILRSKENLGFAGGNNLGIMYALEQGIDYIMFLNNDTYVDEDIIEELLRGFESSEAIGITAPKIYFAKGFEYHKDRYSKEEQGKIIWYAGGIMDWQNVIGTHKGVDEIDSGQFDNSEKTDFASGCCFMMSRTVIEKTGMFDDKYFLYYEESDLCERVKKLSFDILYVPKAIVWHKNAQSSGGSGSHLQDYYITRNRMIFGLKYAPFRTKIALIRESMRLLRHGREWQKRGIRDFYARKFWKGSFII